MVRTSVVYVDSAVRWQRNGAGGLCKETVVSGAQRCAGRSQLTVLVRQRYRHRLFVRRGRPVAQIFSCRSQRSEFCEPPQGGASARPAEAGFYLYKPRPPRTSFPSTFPCCRQLHIPVCRGVCEQYVMGISRSLTLRPGPARAHRRDPRSRPGRAHE